MLVGLPEVLVFGAVDAAGKHGVGARVRAGFDVAAVNADRGEPEKAFPSGCVGVGDVDELELDAAADFGADSLDERLRGGRGSGSR